MFLEDLINQTSTWDWITHAAREDLLRLTGRNVVFEALADGGEESIRFCLLPSQRRERPFPLQSEASNVHDPTMPDYLLLS